MKLTHYGHSCFLIEFGGKILLIDPAISFLPGGEKFDISQISTDYILLSHGHGDHVYDAEVICRNNDATIISNFEIVSWYEKKGLKVHPMNHGGQKAFDFGKVKYVNAVHSSVLPDGTYGGNPGGFVVQNLEKCFYIAGDTALTMDMKLIPMTSPPLDFAILPIGDNFTMGVDDAIIAAEFINCNTIIGCHYNTFPVINIDRNQAIDKFERAGKKLVLLEFGEGIEI